MIQQQINNGLTVLLDWLAFTVTQEGVDTFEQVARMFGLNELDFVQASKGSYGYRVRHEHNTESIIILSDGSDGMGVHVSVSASSLLYFVECFRETLRTDTPFGQGYNLNNFDDVLQVMLSAISRVGAFSRLDIAMDDIGATYFTLDELMEIFDDKERLSTRFRTYGVNLTKNFDDERSKSGHTISLGSRDSDCYLRIYDKRLEQMRKCKEEPENLPEWVRWEMEIKGHDSCMNLVNFLLAGKTLGEIFCGILSNKMRIIIPDKCQKCKCSSDPKWEDMMCSAEKLSISVPKSEKTLDEKREWIFRQVAPTLSALVQAEWGDLGIVSRIVDAGDTRMNNGLRKLVRKKQEE